MKRIIILAVMAALITSVCNAQLKVDSVGRMTLYPQTADSLTSGNPSFTEGYSLTVEALANGGILVDRDNQLTPDASSSAYGITVMQRSNVTESVGVYSNTYGNNYRGYGVKGCVGGGFLGVGVFGGLINNNRGIGIYGSTNTSFYSYYIENLPLAGFFHGDVRATGTIYGTLVSPSSISAPSQGGTTINLSEQTERGETVTEKLQKVSLLQMERINQDGSMAANKVLKKIDVNEDEKGVIEEEHIQTRLPSVSYGLAADQLKEVYPELVYEDLKGNYSINYVEMVPLLVQSIKELSAKVEALEAERDNPKAIKAKTAQMDIADNVNLSIPDKAQKIHLNIYDLSGKLVRTTDVNESGDVRLSTYTKGLPTGTYAYSLIVDGKKQKTRKIIVK